MCCGGYCPDEHECGVCYPGSHNRIHLILGVLLAWAICWRIGRLLSKNHIRFVLESNGLPFYPKHKKNAAPTLVAFDG